MNVRLLLELLEEYTADMERRGRPWSERDHLVHTHNIIFRDQEEQGT